MIIFMVGYLAFASFRTIFVYVSGFSFGLTYVHRLLKLNIRQGLIETVKIYAITFLAMPLLQYFAFLARYICGMYEIGNVFPMVYLHWY